MRLNRWLAGGLTGAIAAACFVAPAIGASGQPQIAQNRGESRGLTGLGHFTPAAADPKLAALLARSGLSDDDFRFTPAESRRSGSRSITVAVRAHASTLARQVHDGAVDLPDATTIGLKPIAYNLGVAVGWKRFAVSGDVSRIDVPGAPGSREAADVGISYAGRKFTGRLTASAERPIADASKVTTDPQSYLIDMGGSYSLSRRLDVTAGVRYKSDNYRLDRLTDNRRDSQAVYIGTALRF